MGWNLPPGVTQKMIDDHYGDDSCKGCGATDCEFEEVYVRGKRVVMCGDCAYWEEEAADRARKDRQIDDEEDKRNG